MIGFAGAHGDTLELLEFTKEVFDKVSPFVHFLVDVERRQALLALGDDDGGTTLVELFDDPVGVKGLVGDEGVELEPADQRLHADRVVALTRQQHEPDEIAERIGQRQDLGRPAALGLAYGLALSPPFAP